MGWSTAYRYLQDALADADVGDEIWIAAGTYIPDEDCANPGGTGLWSASFSMIEDVAIYGGFEGTETLLSERDPVAHVTILSGELGAGPPGCGDGNCYMANGSAGCENPGCCEAVCAFASLAYCCEVIWDMDCAGAAFFVCPTNDNAFRVVDAFDVGPTSLLDGLTITRGISTSTSVTGGGLGILDASPTVVRCIFKDNLSGNGGAVSVKAESETPSEPLFVNCSFIENVAGCYAGGMLVWDNASVTVVNSVFSENSTYLNAYAGAGLTTYSFDSFATLINCVFVGNEAANNPDYGGGVHIRLGSAVLDNCILWGNTPAQISDFPGDSVVSYSDIEDGWPGTGNIDDDPLFFNIAMGDYHLTAGSPCIDKGNPNGNIIPPDTFDLDGDGSTAEATPDLDLNNRIADGTENFGLIVDMGVYEFPACCPWDLEDSGGVGAADLLILLAGWGPNPDHRADFNNDGMVGASDLLALLANWGECPCGIPTSPPTLQEELDDACLTMDDWNEFVAVMTDPNSSEADKDRYSCWMTHYIEDCNKCICIGASGCPNPDPFS
ncbi:MAG: right-handed parallel beta-helix repeat-containing protein [Phycisphaerales bacterium]